MTQPYFRGSIGLALVMLSGCRLWEESSRVDIGIRVEKLWVAPPSGDLIGVDAASTVVGGTSLSQTPGSMNQIYSTEDAIQIHVGPVLINGEFYDYDVLLAATSPGIGWEAMIIDVPVWYLQSGWSVLWGFRPHFYHQWAPGGIIAAIDGTTTVDNYTMATVIDPANTDQFYVFAVDKSTGLLSVRVTTTVSTSSVPTDTYIKEGHYRIFKWNGATFDITPADIDYIAVPPPTEIANRFNELVKAAKSSTP